MIPPPCWLAELPATVQLTMFAGCQAVVLMTPTPPAVLPELAQTRQFAIVPAFSKRRTPPTPPGEALWSTMQCVIAAAFAAEPSSETPAVRLPAYVVVQPVTRDCDSRPLTIRTAPPKE